MNKIIKSFVTPKSLLLPIFSYLNRHVVEKLEVVNKKWVRVNLQPGSSVDGSVRIY